MFIGKKDWLRGRDLNPRPLGYEPNELPDCSTPRHLRNPDDSIRFRFHQGVRRMPKRFAACAVSTVFLSTIIIAQPPVVRTADPIKRGMQLSDFPRTINVADNVY